MLNFNYMPTYRYNMPTYRYNMPTYRYYMPTYRYTMPTYGYNVQHTDLAYQRTDLAYQRTDTAYPIRNHFKFNCNITMLKISGRSLRDISTTEQTSCSQHVSC